MTQCSQCTVFDAPNACEETFLPKIHPSRARTDADAYTQAARTYIYGRTNATRDNRQPLRRLSHHKTESTIPPPQPVSIQQHLDMKKFFLLLTLMAATFIGTSAQQVVIKNNLLYDATSTPNLSLEFGLNKKQTFDVQVGFNPFDLDKQANKKFKHIAIQPEWRYWTCERFNGLFFGIHAHAGRFNVSNMKFPGGILHTLEKNRYEGWFVGAGVGMGYQLVLNRRWSLEAELGAGYAYLDYDKFRCNTCGNLEASKTKDYFGLTKAALSVVYVIR